MRNFLGIGGLSGSHSVGSGSAPTSASPQPQALRSSSLTEPEHPMTAPGTCAIGDL